MPAFFFKKSLLNYSASQWGERKFSKDVTDIEAVLPSSDLAQALKMHSIIVRRDVRTLREMFR